MPNPNPFFPEGPAKPQPPAAADVQYRVRFKDGEAGTPGPRRLGRPRQPRPHPRRQLVTDVCAHNLVMAVNETNQYKPTGVVRAAPSVRSSTGPKHGPEKTPQRSSTSRFRSSGRKPP